MYRQVKHPASLVYKSRLVMMLDVFTRRRPEKEAGPTAESDGSSKTVCKPRSSAPKANNVLRSVANEENLTSRRGALDDCRMTLVSTLR